MITRALLASLLCLGLSAAAANAQPAPAKPAVEARSVKAGELVIDPPTLINLGFEWIISGDTNRNARVDVSYRKKGDNEWKKAMPLMRLQGERITWSGGIINVVMPNMFAGSILDLEPDTAYDARFVLTDPDGASGQTTRIVTVKTRADPKPATGGHIYHVYPYDWKGPKGSNSFEGIMCAYDLSCAGGDASLPGRPRVKAGDVILVHAGVYNSYADWYGWYKPHGNFASSAPPGPTAYLPVEGTYYLRANGTAQKPIVIKAAGDGEVIFDGRGNFNLFNVEKADYTYFEGITFRNTEIAIQAGVQFLAGAKGLTVKHCRFEDINLGINTSFSGSRDFTITDNTFIGRDDPKHLQGWNGEFWLQFNGVDGQEFPAKLKSYTAVRVYGGGHVIAYNYVANFHDGIDVETYGNPDGSSAEGGPYYPPRKYWNLRPVAIDYYNNYMTNFHDNAFEIDGSMHNIRVMRNMMMNSASQPFCNQPALGGPIYWIRNIAYNAPGGAARMQSGAAGVIYLNNTILSEFSAPTSGNLHMFNNLILGENASPEIFAIHTFTNYSESDFNGFLPNVDAKNSFQWTSPAWGRQQDYHDLQYEFAGAAAASSPRTLVTREYPTLAAYAADAHQDKHSVLVDYGIFGNVKRLDAKDVSIIQKLYEAGDFDFSLKKGSAAIDAGVIIPQV